MHPFFLGIVRINLRSTFTEAEAGLHILKFHTAVRGLSMSKHTLIAAALATLCSMRRSWPARLLEVYFLY